MLPKAKGKPAGFTDAEWLKYLQLKTLEAIDKRRRKQVAALKAGLALKSDKIALAKSESEHELGMSVNPFSVSCPECHVLGYEKCIRTKALRQIPPDGRSLFGKDYDKGSIMQHHVHVARVELARTLSNYST